MSHCEGYVLDIFMISHTISISFIWGHFVSKANIRFHLSSVLSFHFDIALLFHLEIVLLLHFQIVLLFHSRKLCTIEEFSWVLLLIFICTFGVSGFYSHIRAFCNYLMGVNNHYCKNCNFIMVICLMMTLATFAYYISKNFPSSLALIFYIMYIDLTKRFLIYIPSPRLLL